MIPAQYIPLSVRVKNWSLSLFSKHDLHALLDDEAAVLIAKIIRKEALPEGLAASPSELLRALKEKMVRYGQTAAGTLSGEGRAFVRELLRDFEIQNLKNLVRMVVSGHFDDVFYNFSFTPSLPVQRYREIRSFAELRKQLDNSFYRSILGSLDKVESEKNTVYWESALDSLYANRIFTLSKRLDPKGKEGVRKLILFPLHLERLLLVYRHRFHYGADPGDTFVQIPNASHMCSMDVWKSFVSAPTSTAFYNLLREKNYIAENVADDASQIYRGIWQKIASLSRRQLYGSLSSISAFLAFYQLKKIQVNQLSTIIEAKSLLVSKEEALNYL